MIDATTSQDEVFAFLGRSSTHDGAAVHRIDTHAAVIFLAGPRAFKVKRAVRFPFLDYSTLDKRKLACDAEIEVNRRFAPDLYRGVVAIIRKADSQLFLGGTGKPIEWAVEMRRFDEKMTLDQLADQGALDLALADSLGRIIATAPRQGTGSRGRTMDRRHRHVHRAERRGVPQIWRAIRHFGHRPANAAKSVRVVAHPTAADSER
jgi:aminoglycoside phosphotransferase family enzyme